MKMFIKDPQRMKQPFSGCPPPSLRDKGHSFPSPRLAFIPPRLAAENADGREFRRILLACLPCKSRSLRGGAGSWLFGRHVLSPAAGGVSSSPWAPPAPLEPGWETVEGKMVLRESSWRVPPGGTLWNEWHLESCRVTPPPERSGFPRWGTQGLMGRRHRPWSQKACL